MAVVGNSPKERGVMLRPQKHVFATCPFAKASHVAEPKFSRRGRPQAWLWVDGVMRGHRLFAGAQLV